MGVDYGVHIGPYFEVIKEIEEIESKRCCTNKQCKANGQTVRDGDVAFCPKCGGPIGTVQKTKRSFPGWYDLAEKFGLDEDALWQAEAPERILLPNDRIKGLRHFNDVGGRDIGVHSLDGLDPLDPAKELATFRADPTYGPIVEAIKEYAVLRYGIVSYAN